MAPRLPDLSPFEWQCLKLLWARGEASARDLHADLDERPGYSTVRKIIERLEEKGAVRRVRREAKAWIYKPAVSRPRMVRKEVRRFLESVFDGAAGPLVAHLADMDALTIDDLRALEERLDEESVPGRPARVGKDGKSGKGGS